jgi:hypothetical protein
MVADWRDYKNLFGRSQLNVAAWWGACFSLGVSCGYDQKRKTLSP